MSHVCQRQELRVEQAEWSESLPHVLCYLMRGQKPRPPAFLLTAAEFAAPLSHAFNATRAYISNQEVESVIVSQQIITADYDNIK